MRLISESPLYQWIPHTVILHCHQPAQSFRLPGIYFFPHFLHSISSYTSEWDRQRSRPTTAKLWLELNRKVVKSAISIRRREMLRPSEENWKKGNIDRAIGRMLGGLCKQTKCQNQSKAEELSDFRRRNFKQITTTTTTKTKETTGMNETEKRGGKKGTRSKLRVI